MPEVHILSSKVLLKTDVKKGQAISWRGTLATTASTDGDAPAGIAQYDGAAGEIIAVTVIGVVEVANDGSLQIGDRVQTTSGGINKVAEMYDAYLGVVTAVNGSSAEILLK